MKYIFEFIAVLVIFLIQTVFSPFIELWGAKPDFIFIYLCFRSFSEGPVHGSILGFLMGLLQDIYSPVSLGINSLAKTLVGFILGRTREGIYHNDVAMRLLVIAIAILGHDIVIFLFTDPVAVVYNFLHFSLPTAAYSVTIAGVFSLISLLMNKVLSA